MPLPFLYYKNFARALLAVIALGSGASFAAAQAPSSPMPTGPIGMTPRGFVDFCARRPDQCGLAGAAPGEALRLKLMSGQDTQVLTPASTGTGEALAPAEAQQPLLANPAREAVTLRTALDILDVGQIETIWTPDADLMAGEDGVADTGAIAASPTVEAIAAPRLVAANNKTGAQASPSPDVAASGLSLTTWALGPGDWKMLRRVNEDINAHILPASDISAFGQPDYWALPLTDPSERQKDGWVRGNCKHYALEKLKALVDAGVPPGAITLAIPRTSRGELHAVLVVSTDRGDYVLDNLTAAILPWAKTGYTWVARQVPGAPLRWMDLQVSGLTARADAQSAKRDLTSQG